MSAPRKAGIEVTDTHKTCLDCGILKPFEDYGKDKRKKDGLNIYCRDCIKPRSAAQWQNRKHLYNKSAKQSSYRWGGSNW